MTNNRRLDKHKKKSYDKFFKMLPKIIIILIILIIAAMFGMKYGYKAGIKQLDGSNSNIKPSITTKNIKEVTIYVPGEGDDMKLTPMDVKVSNNKNFLNNKLDALIAELIKEGILSENTHLVGNIKVENKIATINFSKELFDFHGSSLQEALLLNSIAYTLISKEDKIEGIKFLVEGQKIDSIGGHIEINEPFVPDDSKGMKD